MTTEMQTPSISEIVRSYAFRTGVYALITLVVFESVYAAIGTYGAGFIGAENGPIEMAQVVLAIIGATTLFCAACLAPIGRSGLVLSGAVVAYAAARESDLLFETMLFDDAYKWLVGLPLAILVMVVVFTDRRRLIGDMMWLMRHPAATLFAVAGIFLCFVCQVLDRPEMWVGISNVSEATTTKALLEEYSELFAYLLLSFAGIEAAMFAIQERAKARAASEETASAEIYRIAA